MWQSRHLADCLRQSNSTVRTELIPIRTAGDDDPSAPLREFGATGVFTREVQRAVLDGRADVAVHSLKDLPTEIVAGLCLVAVPVRAARFDALVLPGSVDPISDLSSLPAGTRVGTGSPRRRAQLLHHRHDLMVAEIRGNVETRIQKLDDGHFDAIVLAQAALQRLDLHDRISLILKPPLLYPAAGQGALGIECRSNDESTQKSLAVVSDEDTMRQVIAERSLLRELGAGCHAPLGALSVLEDSRLCLTGVLLSPDGRQRLEAGADGSPDEAVEVGIEVARRLLGAGGHRLV